jgi:hypothetical protein
MTTPLLRLLIYTTTVHIHCSYTLQTPNQIPSLVYIVCTPTPLSPLLPSSPLSSALCGESTRRTLGPRRGPRLPGPRTESPAHRRPPLHAHRGHVGRTFAAQACRARHHPPGARSDVPAADSAAGPVPAAAAAAARLFGRRCRAGSAAAGTSRRAGRAGRGCSIPGRRHARRRRRLRLLRLLLPPRRRRRCRRRRRRRPAFARGAAPTQI